MASQAAVGVTSSGHLQMGSCGIPGSVSRDSQNADARSMWAPLGRQMAPVLGCGKDGVPGFLSQGQSLSQKPVLLLPWNMQDASIPSPVPLPQVSPDLPQPPFREN